ncbi:hypothetical protein K5P26_01250 [Sphingopyxis sp. XHP0097]|jgi:hypothetical protein|uniref:Anti-sigma factor NepR domain-containing protein n=1 Tax=Sphingopyxis jiangsuensis TaxID=2871171 RepID=A0ABS7MAC9_9SPHN|nr:MULTISPECIES: NepR family anti-sigma factor [Sphingopyxis]MBL0769962.1 hypothetical protein [Sphingopyxis lutea]MBY4635763.1 hypothetical protein [Sphingopyxis jiangsuensis]
MSSESGSSANKRTGKTGDRKVTRKAHDVNVALRRAYDSAVEESIPQSMLDLLGKLS